MTDACSTYLKPTSKQIPAPNLDGYSKNVQTVPQKGASHSLSSRTPSNFSMMVCFCSWITNLSGCCLIWLIQLSNQKWTQTLDGPERRPPISRWFTSGTCGLFRQQVKLSFRRVSVYPEFTHIRLYFLFVLPLVVYHCLSLSSCRCCCCCCCCCRGWLLVVGCWLLVVGVVDVVVVIVYFYFVSVFSLIFLALAVTLVW